jgi:transposase
VVKVRGAGGGRVSIAGVACYRPGDRPHLYYQLRVYRRRKGEAKGFTGADYRDLILATHRTLSAPLVWVRDNLNIHLAPELAGFAQENEAWLRIYRLPADTPDLNPAEGIWSLLKRSMVNFAAADLDGLVRIIKRKLKKIQYRPHLIHGCLAAAGLRTEPW